MSLCLDNSTIQIATNFTLGNISKPFTATSVCQYGCDLANNVCNPSPFDLSLIVGGAVIGIILLIIIILRLSK